MGGLFTSIILLKCGYQFCLVSGSGFFAAFGEAVVGAGVGRDGIGVVAGFLHGGAQGIGRGCS
jgi:hypothetical protein